MTKEEREQLIVREQIRSSIDPYFEPDPRLSEPEELPIGECGLCHQQKELVADMEMKASVPATGQVVASSGIVELCQDCVDGIVAELEAAEIGG